MKEILYIQKFIYQYKNDFVIIDKDLSNLFNINISKIIKKYKKIFDKRYCYELNNNFLLNKEGIVLISIIVNVYYIVEKTYYILDAFNILEQINYPILSKISQGEV